MTKSVLDDIPGLGETRKKRLVDRARRRPRRCNEPTLDELKALSWLPDAVARLPSSRPVASAAQENRVEPTPTLARA